MLLSGRGVARGPASWKPASSIRDFRPKADENSQVPPTGHLQTRPNHAHGFHFVCIAPRENQQCVPNTKKQPVLTQREASLTSQTFEFTGIKVQNFAQATCLLVVIIQKGMKAD